MRFSAIHKLSTYLVAATAFLAVGLSGELDPLTLLMGIAGLIGSWWVEAPRVRVERLGLLYSALSLLALVIAVLTVLAGEYLLAGARFLIHLLLIKLFSRRASKDYQQIYLLSFLLLTIGTAINTGMSFAICFLGFVVFATWALILFHLRREMEENFLLKHSDDASSEKVEVERILNSRRIVGPAFLLGTSGVSLAIFLSAIVMFMFIPRVGFGLFFQKSRGGINVAGFSDEVALGGHGTIRDDDTVVMRVYLDRADYRGVAGGQQLHWRGVALDSYDQGRWSRGRNLRQVEQPFSEDSRSTTVYFTRDGRRLSTSEASRQTARGLHQDIYVEPLDTNVLFAAATPLAFRVPNLGLGRNARAVRSGTGDEARIDRATGLRYEAWSDPDPPGEALLRAARDPSPGGLLAPYLQLPAGHLPARVAALGAEITRGARGTYEKTAAVHAYLQTNYSYTLDMETDAEYEPLDYFLFERKQGHCEYFSSAMAILLRTQGVPTRNVNGFLGGEWNEYGGYLAVRGGDAHSWVEVWFEGVGWVTWDPTPASDGRRGSGVFDKMRRLLDTMRLQWFKWVLEYDLGRQIRVLKGVGDWLGLSSGKASMARFRTWIKEHKRELIVGTGTLVALFLAVTWWRGRRAPRAATRRVRPPGDPVQQLYARTVAWLGRRGFPRPLAQTPREHARALAAAASPAAGPFAAFTELYYDARFGAAGGAQVDRARQLADQVRAAVAKAAADARRKRS